MVTGKIACGILVVLCVLVTFSDVCATDTVPVLMWSSDGTIDNKDAFPSLTTVSNRDFYQHIEKQFKTYSEKKPICIIFVEELLSVEDFSRLNGQGQSSYPFLTNLTSATSTVEFLPSVQNPVDAFKELAKDTDYEWRVLEDQDGRKLVLPEEGGVILAFYFKDNVTTNGILKEHDRIMNEQYNLILSSHANVIGIYTAKSPSRKEADNFEAGKLLATDDDVNDNKKKLPGTLWYGNPENGTVLVYFQDSITIHYNTTDINDTIVTTPKNFTSVIETFNETATDLKMQTFTVDFERNTTKTDGTLELQFLLSKANYWRLQQIIYKDNVDFKEGVKLLPTTEVNAPLGFSYHCSNVTTFSSLSLTLNFSSIQIQPFIVTNSEEEFRFGDGYDCVPFYTPGIISGLFVTALITLITAWGICMIMDINTNDQYDDPKGKTISVNTMD